MLFPKQKRLIDPDAMDRVRGAACVLCRRPSDPCHIDAKGGGGHDAEWNLVQMCRSHHTEQHTLGWYRFSQKYSVMKIVLERKGWMFGMYNKLTRKD